MDNILKNHRKIWKQKPLLRQIYADWYRMIAEDMTTGKSVELGSGSGNFKEYNSGVIATDIDPQPWLDMVFDAHKMPFKNGEIGNLIMVDVLHHLVNPVGFLHEASRVLKPGGRLIMVEPYPSPISLVIYKLVHPEPFDFDVDYFNNRKLRKKGHWEANQAIPYLIFFDANSPFENEFNKVYDILKKNRLSFLTYPLSGGFEKSQFYPTWMKPVWDYVEYLLKPISRFVAFRCYLVLEKTWVRKKY